MQYTPLIKQALRLAFDAHVNQVDKTGLPYIYHPLHLAHSLKEEYEIVTALLHDVVEDTDYTFDDLKNMGYPQEVIEALTYLTHEPGVTYQDYVKNIKNNPIAIKVKLADLKHNSDLNRLDTITQKDLERQKKYLDAIKLLEE